ncbi:MAG TPA: hypothetical protein VN799_06110 [Acidimicrobiales bacterium]|nr:hypothetical protein [Acidimicrobiales bacterium]
MIILATTWGNEAAASPGRGAAAPATATIAVDRDATPPGWVPVAFDDVQISVPATWRVALGCPEAVGNVYLGAVPMLFCPSESAGTNVVVLRTNTTPPATNLTSGKINGITVYWFGPEDRTLLVPSIGVSVTATGLSAGKVLHTLTYSPRAVVLARVTTAAPPRSWHRVSFGGLSAAVPRAWFIERLSYWPLGCAQIDTRLDDTQVLLSAGTRIVSPSCPAMATSELAIVTPIDGLVIDPGPQGPVAAGASFGACLHVHGLRVCPARGDPYGILVLSVHRPGRHHATAVEIGLAGSGATARTIVDSLRAG